MHGMISGIDDGVVVSIGVSWFKPIRNNVDYCVNN